MAREARPRPTLHWLASSQGALEMNGFDQPGRTRVFKWKNNTPKNYFVDQNSGCALQPLYSVSSFRSLSLSVPDSSWSL